MVGTHRCQIGAGSVWSIQSRCAVRERAQFGPPEWRNSTAIATLSPVVTRCSTLRAAVLLANRAGHRPQSRWVPCTPRWRV